MKTNQLKNLGKYDLNMTYNSTETQSSESINKYNPFHFSYYILGVKTMQQIEKEGLPQELLAYLVQLPTKQLLRGQRYLAQLLLHLKQIHSEHKQVNLYSGHKQLLQALVHNYHSFWSTRHICLWDQHINSWRTVWCKTPNILWSTS